MAPVPDAGENSYRGSGRLAGRKALITGGDSGIGRGAAIAFAREGADVAINHLSQEEPDARQVIEIIRESGRTGLSIPGDIRDEAFCKSLVGQAVQGLGGLDILVMNAGRQQARQSILDISTEEFDWTFKTNVYAPFWIIKAALPHLKPGFSIIATTSIQAYDPSPDLYDYAQTKAATMNYVKSLAKQLADSRGRDGDYSPPPAQIPACGFPAPGSCRRSSVIVGLDATDPQASGSCDVPCPVLSPGHASPLSFPPTEPPSLHALRRRSSRPCSGASSVLRGSSNSSPVPRQLRLLAFLPWPGIAAATAGQTRSPRFRRDPFVRDRVYDHGRASAPRRSGTAHVAFDVPYRLGLCIILAFAAQYIPHTIAVYASRQPSPTATQHSLPGARYGLPGPVFHRQDRASLPGAQGIRVNGVAPGPIWTPAPPAPTGNVLRGPFEAPSGCLRTRISQPLMKLAGPG